MKKRAVKVFYQFTYSNYNNKNIHRFETVFTFLNTQHIINAKLIMLVLNITLYTLNSQLVN